MTMWWRVTLVGCLIALLVLETIDAKGGGGKGGGGGKSGGGRGGSRGGKSSGGSRGGSSRSGSRVTSRFGSLSGTRSYKGAMYESSYWGTAASIGVLYGLSSYQRRRLYQDSPNKEPTICFNDVKLKNVTYGFFICPEPDQSDDYTYCCGDDGNQRCCDGKEEPLSIAVVIGLSVFGGASILSCLVSVCIWKRKTLCKKCTKSPAISSGNTPNVQYTTASGSGDVNNVPTKDTSGSSGLYATANGRPDELSSSTSHLPYQAQPQAPPSYTPYGYPPSDGQTDQFIPSSQPYPTQPQGPPGTVLYGHPTSYARPPMPPYPRRSINQ